ncbi:MAG: DUF1588 domain-containing protein [Verrucomicrobiota bacterium]
MPRSQPIRLVFHLVALSIGLALSASAESEVYQFLDRYCLDCHDSLVQKGERDFESFDLPLADLAGLISAQEIIDQVTLKEMPPPEADQPTMDERLAVIRSLRSSTAAIRDELETSSDSTVMRRLSNREYENTMEQLFGRRVDTLGLTVNFPKEKTSRHLDTIGEALVTSGFLLDRYFEAANRIVDLRLGRKLIEPQSWHFKENFVQYEELSGPHRSVFKFEYLCLYEQPDTDTRQGSYGHIEDFLEGVPESGFYEIQALAKAHHRDTHYDPDLFKIDLSEPFTLGIVPGAYRLGHIHYPQKVEPLLAEQVVPDDKAKWLKYRVWLEKGQTPRFVFPNGPWESRAIVQQINKRYADELGERAVSAGVSRTHILRNGAMPHIRIGEIKIRGPFYEDGLPREDRFVFGDDGFIPEQAKKQLETFARRVYRRPLNQEDRAQIARVYSGQRDAGLPAREAALATIKMMLCSPSFLYLSEITPEEETRLRNHDLAARLSYALTGGMPDRELSAIADQGHLTRPEVLRSETARLVAGKRAEGFARGFLDSWLNLRDLGSQPPPRSAQRAYYYQDLPRSMRKEAELFFLDLLRRDGPVSAFLDADYTFVDKDLAQLYDIPQKEKLRLADGFERVDLARDRQRGGLLGMAAVLTASANGVETSPVTRGVWVSENILGVVPPPPPDEVPDIEGDTRGATTIREQLAQHSASKTCAECHRKIDPLGFALEHFDPIGRWRGKYPAKKEKDRKPIDASGELLSGESFDGFHPFREVLAEHRGERFTRHLVEQFLAYSTGRHMGPTDAFEIDEIVDRVNEQGGGFQTLILESVTSEIFRER